MEKRAAHKRKPNFRINNILALCIRSRKKTKKEVEICGRRWGGQGRIKNKIFPSLGRILFGGSGGGSHFRIRYLLGEKGHPKNAEIIGGSGGGGGGGGRSFPLWRLRRRRRKKKRRLKSSDPLFFLAAAAAAEAAAANNFSPP